MRKLIIVAAMLLISYCVYYDLSIGTLPTGTATTSTSLANEDELSKTGPHGQLLVVERGYTVLSIVEELHTGPVNAPIGQIIADFEALNPGTSAHSIQIGKAYYFPLYQN